MGERRPPENVELATLVRQATAHASSWQVRPTTFLESAGSRMMVWTLVVIVGLTATLLLFWATHRPDAAQLADELRAFPSTRPTMLAPEEVIDLLAKRQAAYDESYRGMFQLLVLSGLVPLFTLMAGYVFGRSKR